MTKPVTMGLRKCDGVEAYKDFGGEQMPREKQG